MGELTFSNDSINTFCEIKPSCQEQVNAFQTSDQPRQTPTKLVALTVKQRSENHRFGLDERVGGGAPEGPLGFAVQGLSSRVPFLVVGVYGSEFRVLGLG